MECEESRDSSESKVFFFQSVKDEQRADSSPGVMGWSLWRTERRPDGDGRSKSNSQQEKPKARERTQQRPPREKTLQLSSHKLRAAGSLLCFEKICPQFGLTTPPTNYEDKRFISRDPWRYQIPDHLFLWRNGRIGCQDFSRSFGSNEDYIPS